MSGFIVSAIVGIICIILGVKNTKGDISSLHSYHRSGVKEEDKLAFGRLVGSGTIIVGISIILFSIAGAITLVTSNDIFTLIGTVIMITGIVAGLAVAFYGMKKYNGGIIK